MRPKGKDLTKAMFYIFSKLQLLSQFRISAEMLFRFLAELRRCSRTVSLHGWAHGCDTAQFMWYAITTDGLDKMLTSLDIFVLMLAAICQGACEDSAGSGNELPLSILFKGRNSLGTFRCATAINLLSLRGCEIMGGVPENEISQAWTTFVKLLLGCEMARHFRMIAKMNDLLSRGTFSWENPVHKVLAMKLLLKAATLSYGARSFPVAERWFQHLAKEFGSTDGCWAKGPKAQIGLYNFICLPLYETLTKIFPGFGVSFNSLKSNLEAWKSMVS
jgi:3',5'-cyclic-nucleotide phosphodiesterase